MADDNLTIGKYKLVNCLATGQHSQVWEAIDNETTRRVAMKMLLPEALADPEQLASLKSEFKIGSSLEHPNIVKYLEFFSKSEMFGKTKHAYFAMDLFPAMNLKGWFHNDLRGVHIRFKRMVELLSAALEHVHERGWIHRDIKPENVLMTKAAEIRLIDFSLASRPATTISKMFARKLATVKGTRTYMAPEQIMGKALTVQTDIYNLGVTLFELLCGQAPFAGATPKEILLRHVGEPPPIPSTINTNLTPEMDRILLRMLAKKPADRQKSVAEFAVEFRNVNAFKEPVVEEVALTEEQQAEEVLKKVLGGALDSRADALRTKLGVAAPVVPKKAKPKPTPAKQAPAPPQPPQMAPGMMQPMQPMQPMMPYPMQPMYGAPGTPQMPGMPMPGMPMPGGPSPWVSVPAAGGAAAPWMGQPAPFPQAGMPQPGQPPTPGVPPVAPRPAPPPVAPAAVPQLASPPPAAVKPVPPKPPAKAPVRPAAKPTTSTKPDQGMKIDDLLGFDELPPVV